MLLADLADISERLAQTPKRNEKLKILSACLSHAPLPLRGLVARYLAGGIRQSKLGVGYSQIGALGEIPPSPSPSVEVSELDATLSAIAEARGGGSTSRRLELLTALFRRLTESEQRFVARLVLGELRQGALESLVLDAIADAANVPKDRARRARMLVSDLEEVARLCFEQGEIGLAATGLVLFRPVQPMLADSADTAAEALDKLGACVWEYKLDGARIQAHKRGDEVRVYSRLMNDVTVAVPETVERVRAFAADELILDGETIALKPDGTPWPFQETMRRFGRKLDVAVLREELPLSTFFFDCLHVDGRTLLDEPLDARWERLCAIAPESARIPRIVTDQIDVAEAFMESSLRAGHEGLVAKARDAAYAAGRRGSHWIKLKRARTLDLVVLAAEWGSGRRKGRLSKLQVGARDPDRGFVMLGKTFKGLTDELLAFQTDALLARETHRDAITVYVKPELVVEIAFNDLQRSPHYPGGLALRFARVKRYRPDKTAAEADTIEQVRAIYAAQTRDLSA